MNEELTPESPQPNGVDHGLIPVLGTEPVKAKPKRKRRRKVAKATRAARARKVDPLLAEHQASTASASTTADAAPDGTRPVEEAPAPSTVQGVGAIPQRSFERRGFGSGLRHMTGTDRVDPQPVRLSTTLTALVILAAVGASAGVYLAWF